MDWKWLYWVGTRILNLLDALRGTENTIESQGWMGRLNSDGSHSFVGLAKYRCTK